MGYVYDNYTKYFLYLVNGEWDILSFYICKLHFPTG